MALNERVARGPLPVTVPAARRSMLAVAGVSSLFVAVGVSALFYAGLRSPALAVGARDALRDVGGFATVFIEVVDAHAFVGDLSWPARLLARQALRSTFRRASALLHARDDPGRLRRVSHRRAAERLRLEITARRA